MAKPRYRLHWASGDAPKPVLKWVIYDWKLICPVAYTESRVTGRKLRALLNAEAPPDRSPRVERPADPTRNNAPRSAALTAGWREIRPNVWQRPDGALVRGPYGPFFEFMDEEP